MANSQTFKASVALISIMMTFLPSAISQGRIQYPATIKTEGVSSPGSAQVDLQNYDNVDQIFFTYEAEIDMGSKLQIRFRGSSADGDKTLVNGKQFGEEFTRVITQSVTKSKDANFIYVSVFIQTKLVYLDGKEKYGKTTIGVKVALTRRAHIWEIKHENSNNYEVEGKGDLCIGCDEEEEEMKASNACVIGLIPTRTPTPRPLPKGPPVSVGCQGQEGARGVYKYNCVVPNYSDITISTEHILWLCGLEGQNQQLDVVVPNYRVEELIRAALKASRGGSTNVNILLKKPETVYDVQAQDGGAVPAGKPSVNLQYEGVPRPISVHYPTDQAYNPLAGPIREP